MNLSIVLSTQPTLFQAATFSEGLEANLSRISALGYQGVELAIRDPNLIDLDFLAALMHKHALQVPAIGTGQAWGEEKLSITDPDPGIRRAAIERIKSHFTFAARCNAIIIIGLIRGKLQPGIGANQVMTWLYEGLLECSTAARDLDIRIALEPINRYETTLINNVEQGLEAIKQVGADNLGLLLDTFHMNIEEKSIEGSIIRCASKIFHFHVADSNRWYPGAGHLDFQSILEALYNTGYKGYISGEFLPKPDPETAARENILTLRNLGKIL